jgi:hypothetical protein
VDPPAGYQPVIPEPVQQRVDGALASEQPVGLGQIADELKTEAGPLSEQRQHARTQYAPPQFRGLGPIVHAWHDALSHMTLQEAQDSDRPAQDVVNQYVLRHQNWEICVRQARISGGGLASGAVRKGRVNRAAGWCVLLPETGRAPWRRHRDREITMQSTRQSRRGLSMLVAAALTAAAAAAMLSAGGTAYAATAQRPAPSRILFVADEVANSVTEYRLGADGDISPIATIAGADTRLSDPAGVAVDAFGNLWVSNGRADSVTEYGRDADGDVSPIATIAGADTGLSGPAGIAVDAAGHLWVTNFGADSVTEYGRDADGDVSPIATVAGADTGLRAPLGIALAG